MLDTDGCFPSCFDLQFHGSSNTDQLVRIARVLGSQGLHDYLETYEMSMPQEFTGLIPKGNGWKPKPWSKFVTEENQKWLSTEAIEFLDSLLQYGPLLTFWSIRVGIARC